MKKTLAMDGTTARKIYPSATLELKAILDETFENEFFSQKITDRIKTIDDAMSATGRPNVPAFADVSEDMREYFAAQYKLIVIAEALNDGWRADWSDDDQQKWIPWFYCELGSSCFAFRAAPYYFSCAYAGHVSRLCFATKAIAEYAGRQFIDLWNIILLK